jgi:hypothetical protein
MGWLGIAILLTGCAVLPPRLAPAPTAAPAAATSTPEVLPQPTATPEAQPTALLEPTATPASTWEASATPEPAPTFPYDLQLGSPKMLPDLRAAERGCQWMGVAGQVFDAAGEPLEGLVVVVSGELQGEPINSLGLTGLAKDYGPGGYEIELASQPLASSGTLSVQLFNDRWEPLSPVYPLETGADCDSSLIVVNFQGFGIIQSVFLPMLSIGP